MKRFLCKVFGCREIVLHREYSYNNPLNQEELTAVLISFRYMRCEDIKDKEFYFPCICGKRLKASK